MFRDGAHEILCSQLRVEELWVLFRFWPGLFVMLYVVLFSVLFGGFMARTQNNSKAFYGKRSRMGAELIGWGQSRTSTARYGTQGFIATVQKGWRPKTCMPMSFEESCHNRIRVDMT
eukprot:scaffold4007_cov164-Amphora_coffeaeformis.AAC.1